jgi:hypothetical protein
MKILNELESEKITEEAIKRAEPQLVKSTTEMRPI